jgi:ribonucleoside-diphosphate reductase alpha subunit
MSVFNGEKDMYVIKRNGKREIVSFDKILRRIKKIGAESGVKINYTILTMKVIDQLYDGIPATKIDDLSAEQCAVMASVHPDYSILAGKIAVSNHHKNTDVSFSKVMKKLYNYIDINGKQSPLISTEFYDIVKTNAEVFDTMCDYSRDYLFDYFGFKTLERSYLMTMNKVVVERPQHLWMRVSVGMHGTNMERVVETYQLLSQKYMIHATPTLFNIGTSHQQCSSCFLLAMEEDSISGIYNTLKECAMISKFSGGIGLHIHNVRSSSSHIRGTNGTSSGIVPMLRVFNSTAKYVNQGGKRNGSFAIYLEPWHADIDMFLELRKNHGDEELKARDLFYAMWIPDLFMERVKSNGVWTLMCPDECPGLPDVYGDDFKKLYEEYESAGRGKSTIQARDLWFRILDSQMETGTPYILYKDACNKKSNQKNLGTIKSSNLCCEITLFTDETETAVCNLASIALPAMVDRTTTPPTFNFEKLHEIARVLTYNLNRVIDINYYPVEKARKSNMRHRPIGIGIQGLADVFFMMNMTFTGEDARELNRRIFETMYHGALEESCILAKEHGAYETFVGSPASQGILQFDMWDYKPDNKMYDWDEMKTRVMTHGLRNSTLLAPMPTASTSQILGYNECIEPITSNIYSRRTLAGEFMLTNKYLMYDLIALGKWNEKMKNDIIESNGSIQHLTDLPLHILEKYRTVWELSMKSIIDMSADRGVFVCQSQSLNLWIEDPNYNILTSMHFHSWERGLKTGMYYLRRKARHQAQKFTLEPKKAMSDIATDIDEMEECTLCSA